MSYSVTVNSTVETLDIDAATFPIHRVGIITAHSNDERLIGSAGLVVWGARGAKDVVYLGGSARLSQGYDHIGDVTCRLRHLRLTESVVISG